MDSPFKVHGFDNELELITQCIRQWDSLCHYHCQTIESGYNGDRASIQ